MLIAEPGLPDKVQRNEVPWLRWGWGVRPLVHSAAWEGTARLSPLIPFLSLDIYCWLPYSRSFPCLGFWEEVSCTNCYMDTKEVFFFLTCQAKGIIWLRVWTWRLLDRRKEVAGGHRASWTLEQNTQGASSTQWGRAWQGWWQGPQVAAALGPLQAAVRDEAGKDPGFRSALWTSPCTRELFSKIFD